MRERYAIWNRTVQYKNPNEARKDGIAMVFQNLSLVPDLTVWQNIVLGAEASRASFSTIGTPGACPREIVDQLLPGLDVQKMVYELSPGEMQIVEIAKAISADPKPPHSRRADGGPGKGGGEEPLRFMRTLAERGVAINFTSHRLWEVMEICDDVTIFSNGENVGSIDFERDGRDPGENHLPHHGRARRGRPRRSRRRPSPRRRY